MALNQREKALLAVPVLLGGFMGFYNWVHEPLSIRRAEAATQSEQVQAELRQDKVKLSREGDLVARASTVSNEERLIDAWVPGKNAAALLVWHLSQAEQHSGVRIKGITVGDKKVVTAQAPASPGAPAAPNQAPNQAAPANQPSGAQAAAPGPAQQNAAPAPTGGATYAVTVIELNLEVDGHFAEHLLFNQSVEQMPLFLNTDAFSLERAERLPLSEVSKLLMEGKTYAAGVILGASPTVSGKYTLNLYFKSGKPGPAVSSAMSFAEGTGPIDPFVMYGIDSFIQSLLEFYANPEFSNLPDQGGRNRVPDRNIQNTSQLG